MAQRKVVWTRTADIQFAGILEYWVKRNKSNLYSKKLLRTVIRKTQQIADDPLIYKSTDIKDIRVATLGDFSIYYKIEKQAIIITAFWDNRQDPKKLLNIMKKT